MPLQSLKLNRTNFRGPWAGLPIAWDQAFKFDETTYRGDVARACRAGVPGIYTGGTTGEFYALELDEFKAVAAATVAVCRQEGVPVMIGCTSTYTLGAVRRAAYAAEIGADAIQVALPFWMEVADDQVVPFYREVAAAAPHLALSVYETRRAKKALTLAQHRQIKEAVPGYLMAKANADTLGYSEQGCRDLSEFVNVFANETAWARLGRSGVAGCCSSSVYWFPRVILGLFQKLEAKRWDEVDSICAQLNAYADFFHGKLAPRGFTDTAYDRLGSRIVPILQTSLHCRGPYPHATEADVVELRTWIKRHFPDWLTP